MFKKVCFRDLSLLCFIFCSIFRFYSLAESFPVTDCGEEEHYRQGSDIQSSRCGLLWQDQDKEQIQNVFKRFLFHYSKAQNSLGTVERESHSVHPLMRLSPKFTLRRKKQQIFSRS